MFCSFSFTTQEKYSLFHSILGLEIGIYIPKQCHMGIVSMCMRKKHHKLLGPSLVYMKVTYKVCFDQGQLFVCLYTLPCYNVYVSVSCLISADIVSCELYFFFNAWRSFDKILCWNMIKLNMCLVINKSLVMFSFDSTCPESFGSLSHIHESYFTRSISIKVSCLSVRTPSMIMISSSLSVFNGFKD